MTTRTFLLALFLALPAIGGGAKCHTPLDEHQTIFFAVLEGLYVDKDVRLSDLKGTLEFFYRAMFGDNTEVRFRSKAFFWHSILLVYSVLDR